MPSKNPCSEASVSLSVNTLQSALEMRANLNSPNPFSDSMLAAFAIHDARTASAPEQGIALKLPGCFSQMGNLLAGGDVVGPDQGVEESHWAASLLLRLTLESSPNCVCSMTENLTSKNELCGNEEGRQCCVPKFIRCVS